ncbi:PIN domain nuclease [Kribbella sp. NPDC050124]|uniref:PIN domain nuclease n=1 Tax=Kribbella sp. NPDC050124 TaxID=3364114 RepID=UPI0037971B81
MMAGAAYLVDTSVFVLRGRHASVKQRFDSLLIEGRLVLCQMALLECLNNAPNPASYERLWADLHGQRWADVTTEAMDRALDVHHELGKRSQHRGFKLPDLIIAATAELAGLTVLHYDEDYDRIAKITGQPVEWVVPKGSL